jgi:NADPH:quinone reductase-like Zn-dependent oxidoreductase
LISPTIAGPFRSNEAHQAMKAVIYENYGGPEVLQIKEVEKPKPQPKEILIKVQATSVTAGDWRLRKADPFLARIFNGLFRPRRIKILGFEVAGIVEEVGSAVHSFKKGDAVFASCGLGFGGYAEYKCLPENGLVALKPANMSFAEAATVPVGALTALGFLRKVDLKQGDEILIYGASGSVGTFAIQLAKHYGAKVIAVCSTANLDLVKSLGADEVIDYTQQDLTQLGANFDVVFDAVGKTSKSLCKPLLKPAGKFITVKGSPKNQEQDLLYLKELIEAEKLNTVIDRTYTLNEIREAHVYVESFRKKGNVSVVVAQ